MPRARQRAPDRAADAITRFAGSMLLIYRHLAWFVLWTVANVAAPSRFDSHPLWTAHPHRVAGARLLSAFVISPDREAQRSEIRAQLDFESNVLGEVWTEMIAAKLGVNVHQVHEKVAERMATPKPGSVEAGRLLGVASPRPAAAAAGLGW